MAISPPAPRAGAPLSRRLADTQSSPVRELLELAMQPQIISLAGGLPAPDTFDVAGLREAFDEVLSGPDAVRALQYSTTEGDPALRARLAAYMSHGRPRGRRRRPPDHDGLAAGARARRDRVTAIPATRSWSRTRRTSRRCRRSSSPTYAPTRSRGDEHGPDPEALIEAARATGAKVAYLIPTFQNPTGRTMPAERRAALAEAAAARRPVARGGRPVQRAAARRRAGRPAGRASPPRSDRTIVIQTLSKVLSPGLRIGYLRAPAALRGPLAVAKQAADLHTSTVAQLAAERWLARHDLGEHIAGLAAHYRPRRDALLAGARASTSRRARR